LPPAQKHQVKNLRNWFEGNPKAIATKEQEFASRDNEGDLMALAADLSLEVPLRNFLEKRTGIFKLRYFWRAESNKGDEESGPTGTMFEDSTRVSTFVTGVFITLGLITLFAPMWCMAFVKGGITRLGIITAFVLTFTVFLGFGTDAKPTEVLGAAAG
jgi:hypothetical protein